MSNQGGTNGPRRKEKSTIARRAGYGLATGAVIAMLGKSFGVGLHPG